MYFLGFLRNYLHFIIYRFKCNILQMVDLGIIPAFFTNVLLHQWFFEYFRKGKRVNLIHVGFNSCL